MSVVLLCLWVVGLLGYNGGLYRGALQAIEDHKNGVDNRQQAE